eukprot:9127892-Lingulodinium_polyedra.AAC.1
MRSNRRFQTPRNDAVKRRFAAATAREPHARALHARPVFWGAHENRERAICEPLRRQTVDSIA